MHDNYKCRNCPSNNTCNAERWTIDSSIIISILKQEPNHILHEDKLNEIKNNQKGFVMHIILAEVYKEIIKFIEEKLRQEMNYYHKYQENESKFKSILEIINNLKQVLDGLDILEFDFESSNKTNELLTLPGLRMKSRDCMIIATAESYLNTHFLHKDGGITGDEQNIRDFGFKINFVPL